MSRLPPADKLPLALRKDIRDNWETKQEGLEKELSDILGEKWAIDIDPKSIYPYGSDGSWAKESTGAMIAEYVQSALDGLRSYIDNHGDHGKQEINNVASAHVLILDIDTDKKVSYCGCGITASGQLAMLWEDGNLAVNISDVFNERNIDNALNEVPSEGVSYKARVDIKESYEGKIAEVNTKINTTLKRDYTLVPGFEAAYAKLKGNSDNLEGNLGSFVHLYFSALADALVSDNFDSDDMLQEGFNEAVESGKIAFRIVDASQMKETYGEVVVEDGMLYIQTSPDYFGTNINDVANKLVDQL